jgi:hypothetical protein
MLGSLYGLVKAFLKDFITESVRGTCQHKKGIALFLGLVLVCFVVIVVVLYKMSESPVFCGVCHNMTVYVDSWKASSHKDVACIKCHYRPGFMNHLKGKWQDGQLSLVYFVTGKSPTKPHAEIDDASCLQSGCHKTSDLKNDMVFKNVLFSHPRHIEQMKRQKQLRCTTCHSQIVQGAHMTVTDVECFICHFYKTKDQTSYVTGCNTCHFEARGDIKVSEGFTFNHKRYIARGIKCDQCHTSVVSGDGHIQENACLQCHNKRHILEAKYTPEFLHQNHVTRHKVECFTCHSPIKHQISGFHYKGQATQACSDCHNGGLHMNKVSMYMGKGAKLVGDRPNRMAAINMDCNVCHGTKAGSAASSCKLCHGDMTDGMVDRWRKLVKDGEDDLLREITAARAVAGSKGSVKLQQALKDAQFNYEFIRMGNGIHNIVYTAQIVEATKTALKAAQSGEKAAPQKEGQVSCMKLCHGQIESKKVAFGSVSFPHSAHIEGDSSCLKCHTPYADHGNTVLKGCSECHHGEGMGKVRCNDCHKPQAAMVKGSGVKGIGDAADTMAGKVECVQCHTAEKQGKKGTAETIKAACVSCHDKDYAGLADDWIGQAKKFREKYTGSSTALGADIAALEKKAGRHSVPLRAGYDEINGDTQFLVNGGAYHNPHYSDAIAGKIDKKTASLRSMIKMEQEGKKIILNK